MGKRGITVAIIMVFIMSDAFSQELSHQVMVPAAGLFSNSTVFLSQTVGETAIEIFKDIDYTITQGFQQPGIKLIPGTKPAGTGVKVYPNPVEETLTVELFGETGRSFIVTVVNIYGAIVCTVELSFTDPYWYMLQQPVDDLAPGLYLVKVKSRDGVVNRTIKIEKM